MRLISTLKSKFRSDNLYKENQVSTIVAREMRKVVFEGGLGSQLIPLLEKNYLSSMSIPYVVDASYFRINQKISKSGNRADHWSYRLDYYGIALDSLIGDSVQLDSEMWVSTKRNFDLWDSDFWKYVNDFGPYLLPINSENLKLFKKEIGIGEEESYSVIHVRRGDYLRVASHIVTDSMWLGIIEQMKLIASKNVVIASDSEVPPETKKQVSRVFSDTNTQVIYLEGKKLDECILHDFMRSANLLVASNSTFSFTAAVLSNPNTFCLVPSIFYGDEELEEINRGYRAAGDFFVLR